MTIFLASVGFGLVTASVLAIAAVGFTLQFAVTDVLNLAYGAVMIAGAFLAYVLNSHGVNVWIGLVVAVAACAAGSVLLNAGVYAPFQRRGTAAITMVIVSLGMTLIIEFGVQAMAGGTSVSYAMSQGPSVSADGFTLTTVQFVVIGLSLLVMAGTHVLLRYTRLGKAMRATAANRMLARNCGIRTGRVITVTWAITGGLCGLAGVVFAMDAGSFGATSTDLFLVLILAATFLGGPGQAYGAMLGAVIIGLATEVSAAYITPSYKYVIAFVALLVMLGVRPAGLLGEGGRMNSYYLINLLIYAAVDAMACLGLSQQFGVAGVTNFGFIIFQAAGGYTAAILALPSDSANGGFQSYLGGWNLPFPVPWIGAAVVGGLIALPFTFLVGRRLRGDFAAVGLLVTAVLLNLLATNYRPLFNGDAGLSLIPEPLQGEYNPQSVGYQWVLAAVAIALCAVVYLLVRRITESPYGRSLRAMRDNDTVADSLGKNLLSLRTAMLVAGGAIAGLSGGILVSYITTWSPAAWGYAETVVLFAAVIIGGVGNHRGAILGAILVPVGFEEITRYIPTSNNLPPNLIPSLQWVAIGLLIVVFLWFRPQGILPERKRVIRAAPLRPPAGPLPAAADNTDPARAGAAGPAAAGPAPPDPPAGLVPPAAAAPPAGILPPAGTVPSDAVTRSADGTGPGLPAPHDREVVLQAADVVREFGGVRAVAGVSLSVRRGTLTGLIGPNGAGKSTLLAMLAGTLPVSAGQILYEGEDVTGLPAYRRARLGLIRTFQLASEFKKLTVMENLLTSVPHNRGDSLRGALAGPRYWRGDEDAAIARATALLERFGLEAHANSYAGDLSGGQRRMVEIMRALMAEPKVLLLDEPMAGVHPSLARKIGGELVALTAGGLTVLMVEHELAIMDEFCDPVVVMAEGTVLAQGTMSELRRRSDVVEAYLVG